MPRKEPEVTGGTKTILLVEWDSKMVIASLRGTGDESDWVCTALPMQSLFVFPFSSMSAGRGVCCCGPGCVLTGTASHSVLVGSSTSEMPQATVCPEEHISSFSVVPLSLKIQHSRRQKGCSANALLFKQCLKSQRP